MSTEVAAHDPFERQLGLLDRREQGYLERRKEIEAAIKLRKDRNRALSAERKKKLRDDRIREFHELLEGVGLSVRPDGLWVMLEDILLRFKPPVIGSKGSLIVASDELELPVSPPYGPEELGSVVRRLREWKEIMPEE